MAISYLIAFDFLPEDHYGNSIVFHITHNFFMAVLAFWSLHRSVKSRIYRYMWLFIFFLSTLNLFYIAPGRTGMFIYICLILLFLFQKLSYLKFLIGSAIFTVILSTFYYTSENLQNRVHQVVSEVQQYAPGESRTSIGQRFDWWCNSVTLIKQKPVFGHGTGSFSIAQKNIPDNTGVKETNNPHNEYLFITVQFGTAGLVIFLSIFILLLVHARSIGTHERMLLQGVLTAMCTGCLINSFLFDSMQGHFFILLSALLITSDSGRKSLRV
jgi:O-antigen ligase